MKDIVQIREIFFLNLPAAIRANREAIVVLFYNLIDVGGMGVSSVRGYLLRYVNRI